MYRKKNLNKYINYLSKSEENKIKRSLKSFYKGEILTFSNA